MRRGSRALALVALIFSSCFLLRAARAQAPSAVSTEMAAAGTPVSWVEAAAANEKRIVEEDGSFPARYTVHKVDSRNDVTRDVIESRDGPVARLIARNGAPITAAEDTAERQRLQDMIAAPDDFAKRHKRNTSARGYATSLIHEMPRAMLYSYTAGQPQLQGAKGKQIVIDFKPDPAYHPPNMISGLLTGIEGRMWIDAQSHVLTRAEARVVKTVDFGWGMLARIYPGGTVTFEQQETGEGHWLYSYLDEHIRVREMLVKSATEQVTMRIADIRVLPATLSYQEAIHILLETPLRLAQ